MADATFESFFNSGGGGGVDIGDVTLQPPAGTSYAKDAQLYLQTGFFVDKAAYPEAAANERCKVTGLPVTLPVSVTVLSSAHDGAGTIIAAYGSTNILRSTDWGATWAVVATGSSTGVTAVVRAGARFIIAGNSGTTIEVLRSNDGSAWSSGGTLTSTGMTGQTITGAWNGSLAMFVAAGNVTAAVTTPDGAALTQRTLPAALQSYFITAKGSTFYLGASSSGGTYTTDTGAPGSFTTIPVASVGFTTQPLDAVTVGGTVMVVSTLTGVYATSTDLSAWVLRKMPRTTQNLPSRGGNVRPLTSDGTRAYWGLPSEVLWSTDGINWARRSVSTQQVQAHHVVAGRALLPTTGAGVNASAARTADWAVADYVGGSEVIFSGGLVAYLRIR